MIPAPDAVNLNTLIEAFAGLCILFVLRAVMESRDKVRAIWMALYGEKDAAEPNGIIRKLHGLGVEVTRHTEQFAAHVSDEDAWRADAARLTTARNTEMQRWFNDFDKKLDGVEKTLEAMPRRRAK